MPVQAYAGTKVQLTVDLKALELLHSAAVAGLPYCGLVFLDYEHCKQGLALIEQIFLQSGYMTEKEIQGIRDTLTARLVKRS